MEDIFEELAAVGSDDEGQAEENGQGGSGNKDDEAEEASDTKRVVKPKRVISRPRPKLDPARLLGPRGIFTISSSFDNTKFKGKGHELDDLNNVLSRLQHWAHRLFPKMTFEDCIQRIEELGNKKEIQTNMHKIRNGMIDLDSGQPSQDNDAADDRAATPPPDDNAFDQLIATAPAAPQTTLTDEQRARMMRNRLLAEERRMARRIARENELEEQRRAANKAAEESDNISVERSTIVPSEDGVFSDTAPNPTRNTSVSSSSNAIEARSKIDQPSCACDDPAPERDTTQDLSSNKDSRSSSLVQNATVEQSTTVCMDTTAAAGGEEETRVLCSDSSPSHADASLFLSDGQRRPKYPETVLLLDPAVEKCTAAIKRTPASFTGEEQNGVPCNGSSSNSDFSVCVSNDKTRPQEPSMALLESSTRSPIIMDSTSKTATSAEEEAKALFSDSPSKANIGCQPDNLTKPVSPKPRLQVSESDLMDVELTPEPNGAKFANLCTVEDRIVQSSTPTNQIHASQSETPKPVSAVDELMDLGSAEYWEEAFAEEERALACQNQS